MFMRMLVMITSGCGSFLASDNGRSSQRKAIQVFFCVCLCVLIVGGVQCVYDSSPVRSDNRILFQLLK